MEPGPEQVLAFDTYPHFTRVPKEEGEGVVVSPRAQPTLTSTLLPHVLGHLPQPQPPPHIPAAHH